MLDFNRVAIELLGQVKFLCKSLEDEEYGRKIERLSFFSIGEHVRHILEHYDCLLLGLDSGVIDYEGRKRDLLLQTSTQASIERIELISNRLLSLSDLEFQLQLKVSFPLSGLDFNQVETSFSREVLFNIDHAIHHLAIIKIALKDLEGVFVDLPASFGVAQSTLVYQNVNA